MAKFTLHDTHKIAGHYLSYLINNDASGLDSAELAEANEYIKKSLPPKSILDVDTEAEPHFAKCELCGLWADCYKLEIYTTERD